MVQGGVHQVGLGLQELSDGVEVRGINHLFWMEGEGTERTKMTTSAGPPKGRELVSAMVTS
eukprot:7103-Eustigmatos_ZCMA.PRE.1